MQGIPWLHQWRYLSKKKVANSIGTDGPLYHQWCGLLNWALITSWIDHLLFSSEDTASKFTPKNFTSLFIWPQKSFLSQFSTSLGQRRQQCFWTIFFAWVCLCMLVLTWKELEVFLNPCNDLHDRIRPVFKAAPPIVLTITGLSFIHKKSLQIWGISWWLNVL